MKPKPQFREGDVVCHSAAFLKSTSWYTNVPINGRVVFVDRDRAGRGPDMLTVEWADGHSCRILACNVRLYNQRHLEPR